MDERDEVNSEVANDSSNATRLSDFEQVLVECFRFDGRLWYRESPAGVERVIVYLIADAHDRDLTVWLNQHVGGEGSDAVRGWTCFDHATWWRNQSTSLILNLCLREFLLFRPFCRAFSFADVDTYDNIVTTIRHKSTHLYYNSPYLCRCLQTAGRNSCSIVLGDVSNCSYRLTVHRVRSSCPCSA